MCRKTNVKLLMNEALPKLDQAPDFDQKCQWCLEAAVFVRYVLEYRAWRSAA